MKISDLIKAWLVASGNRKLWCLLTFLSYLPLFNRDWVVTSFHRRFSTVWVHLPVSPPLHRPIFVCLFVLLSEMPAAVKFHRIYQMRSEWIPDSPSAQRQTFSMCNGICLGQKSPSHCTAQDCRRGHDWMSAGHPLPWGYGVPSSVLSSHQPLGWQRVRNPWLCFSAAFVNCFSRLV